MYTETPREVLKMPSRNLNYTTVETALVSQLESYCMTSEQNGYVIGVSGGVDSAVVSTLCAKAGLPLYVMELPIHQGQDEVNRAQQHITWLRENFPNVIEWHEDLSGVFDLMAIKIANVASTLKGAGDTRLALANTRARLRMTSLYAMAGTFGLLVAGTGNRVEDYGIGFFTKYGDGGIDVSPIGQLYKSEVRELGRHMHITSALTEAIATDGLHTDAATDEDQIGATYTELEGAMFAYDELQSYAAEAHMSLTREEIIVHFSGRARDVMNIYVNRHMGNAHKMVMPPIFSIE